MAELLASDVNVKEEAPTVRAIASVATSVLGAVGIAERGPIDQEVLISGPDEYDRIFGGYTANSDLALAVKAYFAQGGTEAHVVRTVHHSDPVDPTTKTSAAATLILATATQASLPGTTTSANGAPWALHTGETIVVKVDGATIATATFTGLAALLETSSGATFALVDGQVTVFHVDSVSGNQTITYHTADFVDISAATPEEIAAVINAQLIGGRATVISGPAVRVSSDTAGTASVMQAVSQTATALGFTISAATGSGNVANIHAVTSAEALSLIGAGGGGSYTAAYTAGHLSISAVAPGASHNVQVTPGSTAAAEFGFDTATHAGTDAGTDDTLTVNGKTDGTYANAITLTVSAPTNGDNRSFNLAVVRGGVRAETWTNLSMTSTSARYALTVINDPNTGSNLIALEDELAAGNNTPLFGTFGPLTGGNDGLASLADADFNGGTGVNGDVGMRALDVVQTLTILIVPGRATASVHNAMVTYCDVIRNGQPFAVLDPPANQTAPQIVNYVKNVAALQQLSEHAAIYWPRLMIDNPNKAIFGSDATIPCPPSGHVAGIYARADASKPSGVFVHPAGTDFPLFNVRGLEMPEVKKKEKRELVFPELINPISIEPGSPYFLDGARTLKDSGNFPTIGERRGVSFIETSLRIGLRFMRHKNINPRLYAAGKRTTTLFLVQQTKNEAFASTDPSLAFTVDFGPGLNSPSVANARQVRAKVGLATTKPAEFIFVIVSPDTRALDAELAAAGA